MRRYLALVVVAGVITLLFFQSMPLYERWKFKKLGQDEIELMAGPPMVSTTAGEARRTVSILFLGASYIYFNHMPRMLVEIASSDLANDTKIEVQKYTRGGVNLDQLWKLEAARMPLLSRRWDYVVLQQQSFWALSSSMVQETVDVTDRMQPYFQKAGARPVIMVSWARQPGSHWYTDERTRFTGSAAYMQQQFDTKSLELADHLGGVAVPVGDFWAFALQVDPALPLYGPDGSHPSIAGSYLTALVFYRFLVRGSPAHTNYAPEGLSPLLADQLRRIASTPLAAVTTQPEWLSYESGSHAR